MADDITKCFIYRCSRKPDMYIYLLEEDDFSKVPKAIYNSLGIIEFAMELELSPDKKLARTNAEEVIQSLEENSFYLQLPDTTSMEEIMKKIARKQL